MAPDGIRPNYPKIHSVVFSNKLEIVVASFLPKLIRELYLEIESPITRSSPMARKKTRPVYVEPEEETQEIEVEEPEFSTDDDVEAELEDAKSSGKPISKAKAARAAIDEGYEKPQEAVDWILRTYGVEIGAQHFSAIKSGLKKKEREAPPKPAKRGRPAVVVAPVDAIAPKRASIDEAELLDAMEQIKPLVAAMGVEKVQRLVDLLG